MGTCLCTPFSCLLDAFEFVPDNATNLICRDDDQFAYRGQFESWSSSSSGKTNSHTSDDETQWCIF